MTSVIFASAVRQYRACREAFELYREAAYEQAAAACNDRLLNRRGMAAGISSYSLFQGNETRAHAYASEELIEWWLDHPRLTYQKFESQWIEGEQQ